jgi:hypothetical protein
MSPVLGGANQNGGWDELTETGTLPVSSHASGREPTAWNQGGNARNHGKKNRS